MSDKLEERSLASLEFKGQNFPLGAKVSLACKILPTNETYSGPAEVWKVSQSGEGVEFKITDAQGKNRYIATNSIENISLS